ncbi:LEPR-XLL domain-containing protein [Candidatus Bathyarchaeota archaeon]|nr:MAG: LEPR-XLL domain-containing protein [Candidatus Bathyarchaeota archaeon]
MSRPRILLSAEILPPPDQRPSQYNHLLAGLPCIGQK